MWGKADRGMKPLGEGGKGTSMKLGSRNDFQINEMLFFKIIRFKYGNLCLHFFISVTGSESPKMF